MALASTITLRLDARKLRRLRRRAKALGTTPSGLVRAVLDRELADPKDEGTTLGDRSRRWIGAVRSARVAAGRDTREALAGWNPDRRHSSWPWPRSIPSPKS